MSDQVVTSEILQDQEGHTITIRNNITKLEKEEFLKRVMEDISLSDKDLLFFNADESFLFHFLDMFTDFSTPFNEIDDIVLHTSLKETIMSNDFAFGLRVYIDKQLAYQNASGEAIETVAYLASRGVDAANKVCDVLDSVRDLTKDGKFLKIIPKKKLDLIFGWVQKIVDGAIVALNPAKNTDVTK